MTPRATDVLRAADVVCAEDTRVTGKLLAAFEVRARLERCDENVISGRAAGLVERMLAGEHVAFCSDAGLPGVSDPGLVLVDAAREAGVPVEVLPGASAASCAFVAAGFAGTAFYFGGFLERKAARRVAQLQALAGLDAALIFYESPHRIVDALAGVAEVFPARRVAVCRELTKLHEEVLRGPVAQVHAELACRESIKGEIALVIEPPVAAEAAASEELAEANLRARIAEELAAGVSKSQIAKALAREFGVSKNQIYDLLHQ